MAPTIKFTLFQNFLASFFTLTYYIYSRSRGALLAPKKNMRLKEFFFTSISLLVSDSEYQTASNRQRCSDSEYQRWNVFLCTLVNVLTERVVLD